MKIVDVNDVSIEITKGDIANQPDIDAIVNAANAWLRTGGGVAGAIHRAAGVGLEEECRPLAPIRPGEAVITGAHNLPNRFVIHCLGPVFGTDKPSDKLLEECYRNALSICEEKGIVSVAFPAISTGAFGYPLEDATRTALKTVTEKAAGLEKVRIIRFVLFSEKDYKVFEKVTDEITLQS